MVAEAAADQDSVALARDSQLRTAAQSIGIRERAMLRTLYLYKGHTPKEIAAMGFGFTASQISALATREGWSEHRNKVAREAKARVEAKVDGVVKEIASAIAAESEEICFAALDQTRAGLKAGGLNGARQAQAASSCLRNLVQVVGAMRGKPEQLVSSNNVINFFVGVPQVQPTQVTEIEAKPVSNV
jgi:hypothetical protein